MKDEVHNADLPEQKKAVIRRIATSKLFLISVAVVLIYTLSGFFLLPYVLKRQLEQYVQEDLNRHAHIEQIRVNPYLMTLEVSKLNLQEADKEPIMSFGRLFIDFELKSLFRWAWTFSTVRLEDLALRVDIAPDKTLNLGNLAADAASSGSGSKEANTPDPSPPPRICLERIQLVNGRIDFRDRSLAKPAELMVEPINLDIKDLTTLPDRKSPHRIVARLPGDGRMEWSGELSLRPLWSKGEFKLKNIHAGMLWDFLKDALRMEKPHGVFALSGNYLIDHISSVPRVKVSDLSMEVDNLALKVKETPDAALSLSTIRMEGGLFDLVEREMTAERLDFADGNLSAVVENSGRLNWESILAASPPGKSAPHESAPEESTPPLKIHLKKVALKNMGVKFEDHSRLHPIRMDLERFGIDLKADAQLSDGGTRAVIDDMNVDLDGLTLRQIGEPETLMTLPRTALRGGKVDLGARRISLKEMILQGGELAVWRTPEGAVNFVELTSTANKGAIRREIAKVRTKAEAEANPWSIHVETMRAKEFGLRLSDRGLKTPERYHLKNVNLEVADFRNPSEKPFNFNLSLDIAQGGKVAVEGRVHMQAPRVDLSVKADKVALTPLTPYLGEFVTLSLDSGDGFVEGDVEYKRDEKGADALVFRGGGGIQNLALTRTENKKEFLSWRLLDLQKIELNTAPGKLRIDRVLLEHPKGELIIKKGGRLNVTEILASSRKTPASPQPPTDKTEKRTQKGASDFPVSVNRVRIQDAELDFADNTLIIPFSTRIHDLGGTIDGLSSAPDRKAVMALEGRVNRYGSARIKGELLPLDAKGYSDVTMIFRNVEMTRLTPYTAQFAGRKIESGKISLDLNYKIVKSRLKGENQVVVDSLKLGEHVDNPDATNLPLDLAVALLKDANGRIQLGLPVSGSLDNPEFSYGSLIWKALANVLKKLVTAPFRALASLVGSGDEDLGKVSFEPGRWRITPPQAERLAKLADAIGQRPQLALEIRGQYAPDADGSVLKRLAVRQALARSMGGTDVAEMNLDTDPLNTTDPKTQKAIEKMALERLGAPRLVALKEAHGLKPPSSPTTSKGSENVDVKQKSQKASSSPKVDRAGYAKALFQEMVKEESLPKSDLTSLAQKRAAAVVSQLTTKGGINAGRLRAMESTQEAQVENGMIPIQMKVAAKEG